MEKKMASSTKITGSIRKSGSKPSLVEEFAINGLYGYRDVSLTSRYAATILIAKNGAGKTTLLGALDAFLRCQFTRLANLEFSSISCRLRGVEEELILNYSDVQTLFDLPESSEIYNIARRCGVTPVALIEFVQSDFPAAKRNYHELNEHDVFKKIAAQHGYSTAGTLRLCERLQESLRGRNSNIDRIQDSIKFVMKDTEILYLPTYRRIELPLSEEVPDEERGIGRRGPSVRSRLGLSRRGLFNTDIQFGLSDISDRLSELNREILTNSNQGYREISANIINELLDGTFDRSSPNPQQIPDRESLTLFFLRLKEGGRQAGPYRDFSVPNIDKIYGEGATTVDSNKFLIYFLGKLNTVIEATRDIEGLVQEFIDHCNTYLSAHDPSTSAKRRSKPASDEKRLKLDRKTLKVHVESVSAQRKVPINSLSSGEKQMISLFAKLYLYKGQKIVLIDEPELSLSIDWQRKILMDVVSAPTCSQVIAITHSPFVFENELEPYAKALKLKINEFSSPVLEEDVFDEIGELGS